MTQLGVPVPAGFTVTTDACRAYMAAGGAVPDGLDREIEERMSALEERTGKRFGDAVEPPPRLRSLGRGDLDARDDGLDPQPGVERRRD